MWIGSLSKNSYICIFCYCLPVASHSREAACDAWLSALGGFIQAFYHSIRNHFQDHGIFFEQSFIRSGCVFSC